MAVLATAAPAASVATSARVPLAFAAGLFIGVWLTAHHSLINTSPSSAPKPAASAARPQDVLTDEDEDTHRGWFRSAVAGTNHLEAAPPPPLPPQRRKDDSKKFTLLQATYVGGTGDDCITALAPAKQNGAVWFAGYTTSMDGVAATASRGVKPAGAEDGFAAMLTPSGSLSALRYLGGSADDRATALAPDGAGGVLVAGYTESDTWSTVRLAGNVAGRRDAFVLHQTARGTVDAALRVGGSGDDEARAIALRNGVLWVAGVTDSIDLPTTSNAPRAKRGGGGRDGFVLAIKFTPKSKTPLAIAALTYASANIGTDGLEAIAAPPTGSSLGLGIWFGGEVTARAGLSVQPWLIGMSSSRGAVHVSESLTLCGGEEMVGGRVHAAVAESAAVRRAQPRRGMPSVWAVGSSVSTSVTPPPGSSSSAVLTSPRGGVAGAESSNCSSWFHAAHGAATHADAFVTRIAGDGGGDPQKGARLGGSRGDVAHAISSDRGRVWVAGFTESPELLTAEEAKGALAPNLRGRSDAFVAKVNAESSTWVGADGRLSALGVTYFGGSGEDAARAVLAADDGSAWIGGLTSSADFALSADAQQRRYGGGGSDAFLARLA